jgi:hypothetical protein
MSTGSSGGCGCGWWPRCIRTAARCCCAARWCPGQLEACPERRLVGEIHYLALVCDDAALEARLRTRPTWRAWTDEKVARMLAFNQWVKRNAATTTPPIQLLDTSGHSVQDSAAGARAWVLQQLVASR